MEANTKRNKKTGIDMTGWVTYQYNGMEYLIPVTEGLMEHRFSALMIDIGKGGTVNTYDKINYLLLPQGNEKVHFSYLVDGINHDYTPEGNHPIHLAIYKVGYSTPVTYQIIEPKKYDMVGTNKDYNVKAGEYFVYMGNAIPNDCCADMMKHLGNGFVYHFNVYRNGYNLKHPEIEVADVDSHLNLVLAFKKSINPKDDLFTSTCYDESLCVVAHSKAMNVMDKSNKVVTLPLKTWNWWLDGIYQVVVSHNNAPCGLIHFEWRNGTSVSVRQLDLTSESPYMALQAYVLKHGNESAFIKLAGCPEMKLSALKLQGQHNFLLTRNYWVAASQGVDMNFVQTLFRAIYEERPIQSVDCKEILSSWEKGKTLNEINLGFKVWDVVALYNLTAILDAGPLLLNDLHSYLDLKMCCSTILCGTKEELTRLVNVSEKWERFVPDENRWEMEPYTINEQIRIAENFLNTRNICVPIDTAQILIRTILKNREMMQNWRRSEVENWLATDIIRNMKHRLLEEDTLTTKLSYVLDNNDIYRSKIYSSSSVASSEFENTMSELEELVGLDNIKRHLKRLFKQISFQKKRAKLGLKNLKEVLPHMIFTGNPGTGKTTVARMVGKVFKNLELLKEGRVITADRASLIGRYIGETEQKMEELLKSAHGNVLFIDEAYSLCDNNSGDRKDFGCRVLECLLPVLADPNNDILIILAGYEKEMNQMLDLNPGMRGRFPYTFCFEDFTDEELNEMALRIIKRMDYVAEPTAINYLKNSIGQAVKYKDRFFHNGRWVTQVVEKGILGAMSERLYDIEPVEENRELFRTITENDIRKGFDEMTPKNRQEQRIVGFKRF